MAQTGAPHPGSKSVIAVIALFLPGMILDNFIVVRVIGLVDGAEHNAAFLSVSVLTTARHSQDSSIALHRSPGTLPTRYALTRRGKSWRVSMSQPIWLHDARHGGPLCTFVVCPGGHHEVAGYADAWVTAHIYAHSQVDASRSAAQILDAALTMS